MAVPKKRTSSSKRNMRRAHDGLKKINIVIDPDTGNPKLPHHVSLSDGYYNGKEAFTPKAIRRARAKAEAAALEAVENDSNS